MNDNQREYAINGIEVTEEIRGHADRMATDQTNELELDEAYDSAEDEDFELDAAGQDESEISSSEGEGEENSVQPAKKKRKTGPRGKKETRDKAEDEELDSGDEVTIQKAKKNKAVEDEDDDEGGTGGFVRTRAMKMRTQEERKPLAKVDGATVDVNALWEKMNTSESGTVSLPTQTETTEPPAQDKTEPEKPPTPTEPRKQVKFSEEMIKIKRTYKFAGEMITEEKTVPKDSAEAKIFLSSGENVDTVDAADIDTNGSAKLRRPLRKVSRFDPNPTGSIKKSWEKQPTEPGVTETVKGPKINTVEKSRLDWARYVDQAGIKDELTVHSKAKEGYMGRMDFLGRVDAKREEERRNARLKGM